jgi:hypothetical protein
MHGEYKVKFINAQQAKTIHKFQRIKENSEKTVLVHLLVQIIQWIHIYTDGSADPHKGSAGAGFSCPGDFEGRVTLAKQATTFETKIRAIYMRQHYIYPLVIRTK